ncbi:MAG: PQQ-dependent sugar dehydrogenase [Planctomycetota bacterium]|nr:PQQ-dependent sugar dehydrogenase [Planctomycetota bacterium]
MLSVFSGAVLLAAGFSPILAADVDTSEINVSVRRVFPEVQIRRPIVVTHANDGSDRIFIASQLGVVHIVANDEEAEESIRFLDIEDQVVYNDKQNEEGLLGMAFHPEYRKNGQFFVYYTTKSAPRVSVISRFTVSKDDPNKAEPKSEQEILRIPQPYWNHNGGTIVFGPDGMLYIALGDGGNGGDPHLNGQNLKTWLGSVLRIDVDHQDDGKGYAVPKDNPFVSKADARGEIFAYGIRNIWRMSFDRKTGQLWAGDVGQKLWEEIDIIVKGGNYGWNNREGLHSYEGGGQASSQTIDPIWQYPHEPDKQPTIGGQHGKSITGGHVYRGKAIPGLDGYYVYADYVTGVVYALKYDWSTKKTTENRTIPSTKLPVMSFGEDQNGEVYYTTPIGAIFKLAPGE